MLGRLPPRLGWLGARAIDAPAIRLSSRRSNDRRDHWEQHHSSDPKSLQHRSARHRVLNLNCRRLDQAILTQLIKSELNKRLVQLALKLKRRFPADLCNRALAIRKPPYDRRTGVQTECLVSAFVVNQRLRADLLDRYVIPDSARRLGVLHRPYPYNPPDWNYFGVIATDAGALIPAPEYGEPVIPAPPLVNPLTVFAPAFPTQTLPEPSIAMLLGVLRPLP